MACRSLSLLAGLAPVSLPSSVCLSVSLTRARSCTRRLPWVQVPMFDHAVHAVDLILPPSLNLHPVSSAKGTLWFFFYTLPPLWRVSDTYNIPVVLVEITKKKSTSSIETRRQKSNN